MPDFADGASQLRWRYCCSAEFTDRDSGGGVGEAGSVRNRSACCRGEREHAEHRIASAGHIENLAASGAAIDSRLADASVRNFKPGRGNVQRSRGAFFDEAHAFFAASDQHCCATEVSEKRAARFLDGFVVAQRPRNEKSSFLGVADDSSGSPISVQF